MSTRSIRLCTFLFLLEVLFMADASRAQHPFTILDHGPFTLTCEDIYGDQRYLHIENNTSARIYLTAEVHGSSHFTLSHEAFSFPHDSSRWSLGVYFIGEPGDTSYAYVVIEHADGYKDSVQVIGIDIRDTSSNPAVTDPFTLNYRVTELGTLWQEWDTTSVYVTNPGNDAITVEATMLYGAYGFEIDGATSMNVDAGNTGRFLVRYTSGTHSSASADISFRSGSDSEVVSFIGGSNTGWHNWPWHLDFANAPKGETICKQTAIVNVFGKPMQITDASLFMTSHLFQLDQPPAMPFTLQVGDTAYFTVCFEAPDVNDSVAMGTLTIRYHLVGHSKIAMHPVYLKGWSRGCIAIETDYLHFDTVIQGSVWYKSFFVSNLSEDSVTLDTIKHYTYPASGFTVVDSLPIMIPPGDSVEITVRFEADSTKGDYELLYLTTKEGCGTAMISMLGETYFDTTTIPLQGDQTRSLSFTGDSSRSFVWYRFHNNIADSITVLSASLAQGTYFSVSTTNPSLPVKLASAEVLEVSIQFTGPPGTYDDTLVIVTEAGIVALRFPIDAVISSSDVRSGTSVAANVNIFPNPSSGLVNVEVSDGRVTSIEILDALGSVVERLDASRTTWDGSQAANGVYFVRVAVIGSDGKPYAMTRRVVLE